MIPGVLRIIVGLTCATTLAVWVGAMPVAFAAPVIVSPLALESAIRDHRESVDEFKFLKKQATAIGVRVWLFGGAAASFGHHVKADLLKGHPAERPFTFHDIYRANQDIDLVIDGTEQQAEALQAALDREHPHLQGRKSVWEVRLLRQDSKNGEKEALLGNPNFQNQNTDSHSTGMIELTDPPASERVIRDVRHFDSRDPPFLEDMAAGKLTYYYSRERHAQTNRYKEGLNPEIFSSIRLLIKSFQFGLELRPEDELTLRRLISEFNPEVDLKNPRAMAWLEMNARKLVQNAQDLESALKTLEQLGLRKELIRLGDQDREGSMAWWLSRKPLPSLPLQSASATGGRTARELGLDVVAHEAQSYEAYESILLSPEGKPNAFVSRENGKGEAALYGEGFYTAVGNQGTRQTGMTVRMKLHPDAREGVDFELIEPKEPSSIRYALIKNRNAVTVMPELHELSPIDVIRHLAEGKMTRNDRGALRRLKLRHLNRFQDLRPEETHQMVALVEQGLLHEPFNPELMVFWLGLPQSASRPDLFERALEVAQRKGGTAHLIFGLLDSPDAPAAKWLENPRALTAFEDVAGNPIHRELALNWAKKTSSARFPEFLKQIIKSYSSPHIPLGQTLDKWVLSGIFTYAPTEEQKQWAKIVIDQTHWVSAGESEFAATLAYRYLFVDKEAYREIFEHLVDRMISTNQFRGLRAAAESSFLTSKRSTDYLPKIRPALAKLIAFSLRKKQYWVLDPLFYKFFSEPLSAPAGPELRIIVDQLVSSYDGYKAERVERLLQFVFNRPHSAAWKDSFELLIDLAFLEKDESIRYSFMDPATKELLAAQAEIRAQIEELLAMSHWASQPEVMERYRRKKAEAAARAGTGLSICIEVQLRAR